MCLNQGDSIRLSGNNKSSGSYHFLYYMYLLIKRWQKVVKCHCQEAHDRSLRKAFTNIAPVQAFEELSRSVNLKLHKSDVILNLIKVYSAKKSKQKQIKSRQNFCGHFTHIMFTSSLGISDYVKKEKSKILCWLKLPKIVNFKHL